MSLIFYFSSRSLTAWSSNNLYFLEQKLTLFRVKNLPLLQSMKSLRIIFVLIICFCVLSTKINAQHADTGKVEYIQDHKIKELLNKQQEINSKAPIKGYRIKIHFGADKAKAKEIKAKFVARFPKVPAYEKYDQPNFNIRVGDFRTKLEAYRFLKEVQVEFPSSFIVQDDIEFPSLEE